MNIIGVDMGGTNTRASIITKKKSIIDEVHVATPTSSSSILSTLIQSIHLLLSRNSLVISAIGVGASGVIHPVSGEVIGAGDTIPGWLGTKLKRHLNEHFQFPVFVGNDVNIAALGESWLSGLQDFVFVSIGTGLGGAIVHEGKVITGSEGGAGEFGHSILHFNGIPCGCGKMGCAEKYVSGTALGIKAKQIDPNWDSFRLVEEASRQNKKAVQIMNQFTNDLGIVLVNIQSMFDPPVIVIGGGLADSFEDWKSFLDNSLVGLQGENQKVNLLLSENSSEIGMLGAVKFALHKLKG